MSALRVLAHVCCGPCAVMPLTRLVEDGHEVTAYFYNPNIHPAAEYLRRRESAEAVARALGLRMLFADKGYDVPGFLREVAFREEHRCRLCYHLRFRRTASVAKKGDFDAFTSTLLFSKRQKHELIVQVGHDVAGGGRVRFLDRDFRADWDEGRARAQAMGLYRQDYCGCIYSEVERRGRELRALSQPEAS